MSDPRSCPSCGGSVPPTENSCPVCGFDLSMASFLGVDVAPTRPTQPPPRSQSKRAVPLAAMLLGGVVGGCVLVVVAIALWALPSGILDPRSKGPTKGTLLINWPVKERFMAKLVIDGRPVAIPGDGPVRYSLDPGKHKVVLSRNGYESITEQIALEEGESQTYKPEWVLAVIESPPEPAPAVAAAAPAAPVPAPPAKPAAAPPPQPVAATPAPKPATAPAPASKPAERAVPTPAPKPVAPAPVAPAPKPPATPPAVPSKPGATPPAAPKPATAPPTPPSMPGAAPPPAKSADPPAKPAAAPAPKPTSAPLTPPPIF